VSSKTDADNRVHIFTRQAEGFRTDLADGYAVGELSDRFQPYAFAGGECLVHGIGVLRLNANHPGTGFELFYIGCDACDESTAADRYEDCIGLRRELL